jgi:hypothetical protein
MLVICYGHEMDLTAFLVHVAQTHREFACQAEPYAHTIPGLKVWIDASGEISGYYLSS